LFAYAATGGKSRRSADDNAVYASHARRASR
jgi:hypothetical protein